MNELTVNESAHFRRGDLQCYRGPKEHRGNAGGRYHWVAQWPPWFLRCDDINLNEMKLMKVRSFSFVAFDWSNSARFLLFLENLILRLWSLFDRQLFILSCFHAVYHLPLPRPRPALHTASSLYTLEKWKWPLKTTETQWPQNTHIRRSAQTQVIVSRSQEQRESWCSLVIVFTFTTFLYMFFSVCVCFGCSCERRNERPKYVISPWNPSERKNSCLSQ